MKRTLLVAAALLVVLSAASANAAVLYTEDFIYVAATQLNGQGGWAAHSGAGTNPQLISASGLSYAGYPGSGVGLAVGPTATSGEDNNHTFTAQTAGDVYLSFLVNVTSTQTTGDYFIHFFDGAVGSGAFFGRAFVRKDPASTNFDFGIQLRSTGPPTYTGAYTFAPGTTYLVVIKYSFVAGANNDTVALFVNPTLGGAEPSPTVTTSNATDADAANVDGVAIRQGTAANAASVTVDAIRVSTSWIDATTPVSLQRFEAD